MKKSFEQGIIKPDEKILSEAAAKLKHEISSFKFDSSTVNLGLDYFENELDQAQMEKLKEYFNVVLNSTYLHIYRSDINDPQYTHANVHIGRIEIDKDGNPKGFSSEASDAMIKMAFEKLKTIPFFRALKSKLGIVSPTKNEYADALNEEKMLRTLHADEERKENEIIDLSRKNYPEIRGDLNIEDDAAVLSIGMQELGILDSEDERMYLETTGAGPCVIVTGYDKENMAATMTHIDGLTDEVETVNQLINLVGGKAVRVFGGDRSSIKALVKIKEVLDERSANVLEWDVLNSVKDIILDKRTGEVFNVIPRKRAGSSAGPVIKLIGKQPARILR